MALTCNLALSSMHRLLCQTLPACASAASCHEALMLAMLAPVLTCMMRGEEPLAQNSGSPRKGSTSHCASPARGGADA